MGLRFRLGQGGRWRLAREQAGLLSTDTCAMPHAHGRPPAPIPLTGARPNDPAGAEPSAPAVVVVVTRSPFALVVVMVMAVLVAFLLPSTSKALRSLLGLAATLPLAGASGSGALV